MNVIIKTLILMVAVSFMAVPIVSADSGGKKLFKKSCKMCHAVDKKKSGPALTAMSQDANQLRDVITNGGKKRMMKAYGKKLSAEEVNELVAYIRSEQGHDDDAMKKHDKKKDDKKKDKKKKHDKDSHDD